MSLAPAAARLAALILLSGGIADCSVVSSDVNPLENKSYRGNQSLGSYFLAKQVLVATFTGASKNPQISLAVQTEPDITAEIELDGTLSAFSNDDIKIETKNGLLTSVHSINNDQTGQILVEIAGFVGRYLAGSAPATGDPTRIFTFDPFRNFEAARANEAIRLLYPGTCIAVEITEGVWTPGCHHTEAPSNAIASGPRSKHFGPGIYYRRAQPYTVAVDTAGKTVQSVVLPFSNISTIYRVDVKRTLFVKRETTLSFADGELTSIEVVKDSEALAVAKLPLQIVDAIIAGPVDALTQRTRVQTARANYYDAAAKSINSEAALRKVQSQLPDGGSAPGQNLSTEASVLTGQQTLSCANVGEDPVICADYLRRSRM